MAYGSIPFTGTGEPLEVELSRLVVEVIGANDDYDGTVLRVTAEVIHDSFAGNPPLDLTTDRLTIEVIHNLNETSAKKVTEDRFTAEVVHAASTHGKGLRVANANLGLQSQFWVLDALFGSDGIMSLGTEDGKGLQITGNSSTLTVRYWDGSTSTASATFANPGSPFLLTFISGAVPFDAQIRVNQVAQAVTTAGSAWATLAPTEISLTRGPSNPTSGYLAELKVFDRVLSTPNRNMVEACLTEKWLGGV